jgi:hypothetical protein
VAGILPTPAVAFSSTLINKAIFWPKKFGRDSD